MNPLNKDEQKSLNTFFSILVSKFCSKFSGRFHQRPSGKLYMGVGDSDGECFLMCSRENISLGFRL